MQCSGRGFYSSFNLHNKHHRNLFQEERTRFQIREGISTCIIVSPLNQLDALDDWTAHISTTVKMASKQIIMQKKTIVM
jgi:hypothetical protein